MSQIIIEHNPSEERLQELGVSEWPIWEKEVSKFTIDFDETETAYVLDGEILVTPTGGEAVRIVPGDLVIFQAGLDSHWEVVKPLRKHYHYD
ncbi:cupin domain-containing protein [Methylomonas sp. MED-D]|uniref:Cupin n=1 Tax=Methylomonas koyamae TaxID=702114 RepID=A0A177NJR9_9GAMM|nr:MULTISPECIES: cupin domain-containing protein [Methylomonas]NJA06655.1 cupin domain-containing protein [Methylococcaceae bacterium WWC4]MDT4329957.1 cupin domain-containing protein [Methylomonas sp. MV1]OAI18145.1 cupin [Methylomonas koyamae]OHX36458.1 cupin [Methylomonas sp. LWB]WGS86926.1 cupin domain-containing protein [Methylomonas sp. UP202]